MYKWELVGCTIKEGEEGKVGSLWFGREWLYGLLAELNYELEWLELRVKDVGLEEDEFGELVLWNKWGGFEFVF